MRPNLTLEDIQRLLAQNDPSQFMAIQGQDMVGVGDASSLSSPYTVGYNQVIDDKTVATYGPDGSYIMDDSRNEAPGVKDLAKFIAASALAYGGTNFLNGLMGAPASAATAAVPAGGVPAAATAAPAGAPGSFNLGTGLFDMFGTDAIGATFSSSLPAGMGNLGVSPLVAASGGGGSLLNTIGNAVSNAGTYGALKTIGQLAGGIAGALDSKDGETEQKREPWGPAQGWIKDNMQRGQQLQQQLQANPFTPQQQAGYQNLFGLLNSANQGAGGLLGNVTNVANNKFDRANPRKRAAPMQGLMGFNPTNYGG
jgi:hypothetical protein